ncbi:MAG: adenylate/guanylate cyclase domain-containing protein [Thermodesulfobacteriota bacterium]
MISWLTDSIVSKITLLVMGGTSLVLGLVLAHSYTSSRDIILRESEQNARNLTLSVARRIEQEFRAVSKVPAGMAEYVEAQAPSSTQNLLDLIRALVANNPEVFGAAVAFEPGGWEKDLAAYAPYFYRTAKGIEYVQLATPAYNYFQMDYYHIPKLLGRPLWTNPYFDEGGGNILMVTYSVPLFWPGDKGEHGDFRGIVTADVSLEWLTELVESIKVAQTGYCFIISDTGQFVTYPNGAYIMSESIFSIAEEQKKPRLREIGRSMIRAGSGFEDIGDALTEEEAFLAFARIPSTGWALGAVFPKHELLAEVRALHHKTVVWAGFSVALLLLVSILVARSVAKPLLRMADAAEKVGRGELDIDLSDIKTTDEVGQLARSLGHMTEGLKQRDFIRDTFGRYVTRDVVSRLLDSTDGLKLGGESREITLMMSDLRGFTALTSHMKPEDIISFLNRYLGKMVEILLDHRGVIDEIIGDGILAFFGAPEPLRDHPARALACALRMQEAMKEINALNEADGLAHLEMGIAIHTGTVVVGNIGSERRSKYGAVGSAVNFTGRMESYSTGGQVLISQAAYDHVADIVTVNKAIGIQMKGVPGTVTLYDVKGIGGPYNVYLSQVDETSRPLVPPINVTVWRLLEKTVQGTGVPALITHASQTSVVVDLCEPVEQWEDLRIKLETLGTESIEGELYGKVVSAERHLDSCTALVRLTSMSPHVHQYLTKPA